MTNPFGRHLRSGGDNPFGRQYREQERERISALQAFGSGAADTFSFGFGDELMGVGAGSLAALSGGDYQSTADRVTGESRRRRALAEAEQGGAFMLGQVGGAIAGGGGLGMVGRAAFRAVPLAARLAQSTNWVGRMGAAGASGAAGGAAYGAGSGDAGNRAESAAQYGVTGAIGGAALSGLGSIVSPHINNAIRGIRPSVGASEVVGQALAREGLTDTQFQARLAEQAAMGRGGMVLDALGRSGGDIAMGASRRPSTGLNVIREAMDARQAAVGPRAQREVWEELVGGQPEDVAQFVLRMDRVKRNEAAPLYAEAWRTIGRINPQAMGAAQETVRRHPDIFRPALRRAQRLWLAETGQETLDPSDPRYWHYMLQGAERELGARLRAASMGDLRGFGGQEAAIYSRAVRQFNDQVRRNLGPVFRRAQDTYAGASAAQDAAELGYTAISGRLNTLQLGALQQRIRRMSQGERDAFRAAAANNLQDAIANATREGASRSDALRGIIGTEGKRRMLEGIFGQRGLETLLRRFDYDRELLNNSIRTGIDVNSITSAAQAAQASQLALTGAPTSAGGVLSRMFTPHLRDMAERHGEAVSDRILTALAMPADDALAQLAQPVRRGLLSRARQQSAAQRLLDDARARRDEIMEFRQRELANTLFGGLYSGAFSQGVPSYGGVER